MYQSTSFLTTVANSFHWFNWIEQTAGIKRDFLSEKYPFTSAPAVLQGSRLTAALDAFWLHIKKKRKHESIDPIFKESSAVIIHVLYLLMNYSGKFFLFFFQASLRILICIHFSLEISCQWLYSCNNIYY